MRKPKDSKKLIILDYRTTTMHIYYIEPDLFVNAQYLRTLGYNPDDVVYMFGDIKTNQHSGVLRKN